MDYESWRIQQQSKAEDLLYAHDAVVKSLKEDLLGSMALAKKYWEDKSCVGVVLTGPEGCGKHTLLSYILYAIKPRKTDAQCLFLDGEELEAEGLKGKMFGEFLGKLMDDCWDNYRYAVDEKGKVTKEKSDRVKPLDAIVVMEQPEKYSCCKEFFRHWQDAALADYGDMESPRMFLVVLSTESVKLPYRLSARMGNVVLNLPGEKFRQRFAQSNAETLLKTMPAGRIAELTDGMSYAQLKAAIDAADCLAGESSFNRELLEEFLDAQKPILNAEESHKRFEEKLPQILGKMAEKGFAMPVQGMVANGNGISVQNMPTVEAVVKNEPVDTASVQNEMRKQLESMDGGTLSQTIMGGGRNQRLLQAYQEMCQ